MFWGSVGMRRNKRGGAGKFGQVNVAGCGCGADTVWW